VIVGGVGVFDDPPPPQAVNSAMASSITKPGNARDRAARITDMTVLLGC
jgi:hypothetical protein